MENSQGKNGAECEESDVDTGLTKHVRTLHKINTVEDSTPVDEATSASPTNVINVAKVRGGSGTDIANDIQNASSPSASPPRKKLISALKNKLDDDERSQRVKLAHEIALDTEFKLPDPSNESQPSPNDKSPEAHLKRMEKTVKDIVQRAFWDSVRAGIESDPPKYDHAFVLLKEIKDILLSLLPPNRVTSFHKRINEYMDLELFRQQAENDTLDVKAVATFVIDIMAGMCAPIRDDQVAELRSIEDVVDLFKEIHKVLGLMKIDIANFAIKSVRPHIRQQQFEYERSEFAKLHKNLPDGLKKTKEWLSLTYIEVCKEVAAVEKKLAPVNQTSLDSPDRKKFEDFKKYSLSPLAVLKTAYTRLMTPGLDLDHLPETLQMDHARVRSLRQQVDQIVLVSSVMITSCGVFGQPLASHQAFLTKLKDIFVTLTAPVPESSKDSSDLLGSIYLQCWKEAEAYVKGKAPEVEKCITSLKEDTLKEKIMALDTKQSHPVYSVLYKRTIEYLRITADILANHASTTPPNLPQPPSGITFLASEIVAVALQYAKLVNLNQTIYGPFYVPILREVLGIPKSNSSTPTDEKKGFSPKSVEDKGARRKLNLAEHNASKDTPTSTPGKHKVTGSLTDLD